jgi:hypothetical protein
MIRYGAAVLVFKDCETGKNFFLGFAAKGHFLDAKIPLESDRWCLLLMICAWPDIATWLPRNMQSSP